MSYQEVVIGTANAGNGDNPFEAWTKTKANIEELYALTPVSVTGTTSLTSSALGKVHICTGTSADYTVDLPTAVGNEGVIIFKGAAALTKVVTIQGVSGQTIDGESDRKFSATGMIAVLSDGANWVVVNEVGSWIPYTSVLGGFSADPTFDRQMYFRVGKTCTVIHHTTASGTSGATTKTITLPFNADSVAVQIGWTGSFVNNGTASTTPGMILTRVGSNTADLYRDFVALAWTASGACRINFIFTYKIA